MADADHRFPFGQPVLPSARADKNVNGNDRCGWSRGRHRIGVACDAPLDTGRPLGVL